MSQRDSQRIKAYRSEWAWKAQAAAAGIKTDLLDFDAVADEVERILGSQFVRDKWGDVRVGPVQQHTGRRAFYRHGYHGTGAISFPRKREWESRSWSWDRIVVCHEVAHAIIHQSVKRDAHGKRCAGHGREWANVFVALVSHFIGVKAAKILKACFKANGVKYIKSRGPLTPEQRERAKVILADARVKAAAARRTPVPVAASRAFARPVRTVPFTYVTN